MKVFGIIWKIVRPLLGAIVGLVAAEKFNLFSFLSFVNYEEAFNICITVYFALAEILLDELCAQIKNIWNNCCSKICVTLYMPRSNPNINHNPEVQFNSQDSAEICIEIKMTGKKTDFKNSKLFLRHLSFADIQPNYRSSVVSVTEGDYCVDLQAIFGGEEKRTEIIQNFKIVLSQCPVDGDSSSKLIPEITNKKRTLVFKKNYANVRTVNNYGSHN